VNADTLTAVSPRQVADKDCGLKITQAQKNQHVAG